MVLALLGASIVLAGVGRCTPESPKTASFGLEASQKMLTSKPGVIAIADPFPELTWVKARYYGAYRSIGRPGSRACPFPNDFCAGSRDEREAIIVLSDAQDRPIGAFRWMGAMHIKSQCRDKGLRFRSSWTKSNPSICRRY